MRAPRTFCAATAMLAALATATATATAAAPAPGAAPHVRHERRGAVIVDRQGRQLTLRGVNVNGLVQYPADFAEAVAPGVADAREMAALGFNLVRLNVSWSRLEPPPAASRPAT